MTLSRDIANTKQRLIKKVNARGLYENFGQTEVRKLKDKYDYLTLVYGTPEQRRGANFIEEFNNWAMSYCG